MSEEDLPKAPEPDAEQSPEPETSSMPPDIDAALSSLLSDLDKDPPPAEEPPAPTPVEEEQAFNDAEQLLPSVAFEEESAPPQPSLDDLEPAPPQPHESLDLLQPEPESSAVNEPREPKFHFSEPKPRPRRWPWVVLVALLFLGSAGYQTRSHWLPKIQSLLAKLHKPSTGSVATAATAAPAAPAQGTETPAAQGPASLDLPPMEDMGQPDPALAAAQGKTEPSKEAKPAEQAAKTEEAKPAEAKAVVTDKSPAARAPARPEELHPLDSALISDIKGRFPGKDVAFRCNLALFSSAHGLQGKLPPFEESLRAVTSNIFYFTGSGKPNLPDLEQQILLKAGFLFPEGKLIRVELRDLQLEAIPR